MGPVIYQYEITKNEIYSTHSKHRTKHSSENGDKMFIRKDLRRLAKSKIHWNSPKMGQRQMLEMCHHKTLSLTQAHKTKIHILKKRPTKRQNKKTTQYMKPNRSSKRWELLNRRPCELTLVKWTEHDNMGRIVQSKPPQRTCSDQWVTQRYMQWSQRLLKTGTMTSEWPKDTCNGQTVSSRQAQWPKRWWWWFAFYMLHSRTDSLCFCRI